MYYSIEVFAINFVASSFPLLEVDGALVNLWYGLVCYSHLECMYQSPVRVASYFRYYPCMDRIDFSVVEWRARPPALIYEPMMSHGYVHCLIFWKWCNN